MADKAISELISAEQITATDMFVLEQNGTAKKLTGQVLLNWLTAVADGHGGIQSIVKTGTSGLQDTYRITMADTTIFNFVVTNGRSINSIKKTAKSGLTDTYTISYNDGTTGTFTVTNGAKGDTGDAWYVWVKWASQEPTETSHSFGDLPDSWMGIYSGTSATAPTDWTQYQWYEIKGDKGDTGDAATLVSAEVTYQVGETGTIVPSGSWSTSIPVVAQGRYLWTRIVQTFNTGNPITAYTVSRMGIDGLGSVVSVNNVSPDAAGNVALTAENIGALPVTGGDMEGPINMNGQTLSGLNTPVGDTEAATKGYVIRLVKKAAPRNLLDNSDFTNPVNQRNASGTVSTSGYFIDRWKLVSGSVTISEDGLVLNGEIAQILEKAPNASVVAVASNGMATFDESTNTFRLTGSGEVVSWAALYEGEYTAETLPEYQSKGYAAELAACQRYCICFGLKSQNNHIGWAQAATSTVANAVLALPQSMRINAPTITVGSGKLVLRNGVTDIEITSVAANTFSSGPFGYMAVNASGMTPGTTFAVRLVLGTLNISADL